MVVSTHLKNVNQIGLSSDVGENHFKLDIFSAQVDARPIQTPLGVGSPRRSNVAKGGVFFVESYGTWLVHPAPNGTGIFTCAKLKFNLGKSLHFLKRSFEQ